MHIGHIKTEPCRFKSINIDIDKTATCNAFGINRSGTWYGLDDIFDLLADLRDHIEIRPRDFYAHRGFDAGSQHIDAVADRHDPNIRQRGNINQAVKFCADVIHRHARAPFLPRPQLNRRFDHREWSRIGRRLGSACLTVNRQDLRNRCDKAVCLLDHLGNLAR